MKLFFTGLIALIVLVPTLHAELPVWVECAGVVDFDSPINFAIQGNVLIDVVKNVQVRTTVLSLNLTNGIGLYIGNGLSLDTLLHFPGKGEFSFYGVGGFGFVTGGGSTVISIEAGLGAMLITSKPMKPFLEALFNFSTYSGGSSHLSVGVSGGVRFR